MAASVERASFNTLINIYKFPKQGARQRFGIEFDLDDSEDMVGNSYDDSCFQDAPDHVPEFEVERMNLTVLSRWYNLYFVAIRNQIYVYWPRNINQAVPGKPDLVIRPPSITGLSKPNSIWKDHPHCVNNLIAGEFGKLEILLIAFDDGDVYAYYMEDIEAAMQNRKANRNLSTLIEISPFLKESIDDSAWGLAIDGALRLIAVSSNNRRITLFCFARSQQRCNLSNFHEVEWDLLTNSFKSPHQSATSNLMHAMMQDPSLLRQRTLDVKILIDLPPYTVENDDGTIHNLVFVSISRGTELLVQDGFSGFFVIQYVEDNVIPIQAWEYSTRCPWYLGWGIMALEPGFCIGSRSLACESSVIFTSADVGLANTERTVGDSMGRIIRTPHRHSVTQELDASVLALKADDDRLSMLLKVPELNLVIVGSPIGTVALLTAIATKFVPPSSTEFRPSYEWKFSVSAILPSREQHSNGDRPDDAILIGIAISPLQRKENSVALDEKSMDKRRWNPKLALEAIDKTGWETDDIALQLWGARFRLLLYYDNHTILSYELSRALGGKLTTDIDNLAP